METVVRKWGNSLGIRIPKPFAEEVHIYNGNHVNINLVGEKIIIKPLKKKYDLNKMLNKINNKNLHSEINTGNAVGKEAW